MTSIPSTTPRTAPTAPLLPPPKPTPHPHKTERDDAFEGVRPATSRPGAGATTSAVPIKDAGLIDELAAARTRAHLAGNSTGTSSAAATTKVDAASPRSAEEIKRLFGESVYPAVKEAIERSGGSTNSAYCERAAGMTKYALDKLGVANAKVVSSGGEHAFVEVIAKDGTKVILDPTAAQNTADGTALDTSMQRRGLAGTREELRQRFAEDIKAFGTHDPHPDVAAAIRSGKDVAGTDRATSEMLKGEVYAKADEQLRRYEGSEDGALAKTAEKERRWALGDRTQPLMLGGLDAETGMKVMQDVSKEFKAGYDALDRRLAGLR